MRSVRPQVEGDDDGLQRPETDPVAVEQRCDVRPEAREDAMGRPERPRSSTVRSADAVVRATSIRSFTGRTEPGQDVVGSAHVPAEVTDRERLGPMAERDEAPVAGQDRVRVGRLAGHVPGRVVGRHPRPRPPVREAAVEAPGPGHRAATAVAVEPDRQWPVAARRRVLHLPPRHARRRPARSPRRSRGTGCPRRPSSRTAAARAIASRSPVRPRDSRVACRGWSWLPITTAGQRSGPKAATASSMARASRRGLPGLSR